MTLPPAPLAPAARITRLPSVSPRQLPRTLRSGLAAGVVLPVGLLALASPAAAQPPEGWSESAPVSLLDFLLLLLVAPLGLAALIALLTYLPSMIRGEGVVPGPGRSTDQWFGGPTRGTAELAAPDGEGSEAGGAGVRW